MEKGRIIFLNGVTSAGKTSIVDAIRYSVRVDISIYSSEECAEKIIRELFHETIVQNHRSEEVTGAK